MWNQHVEPISQHVSTLLLVLLPRFVTIRKIASIRLKYVRDGVEDWELLRLAEAAVGRTVVMETISPVIQGLGSFTDDPAILLAVRRTLGQLVAKGR
jgi:hypothetical protein